jgi:hypothetical protein
MGDCVYDHAHIFVFSTSSNTGTTLYPFGLREVMKTEIIPARINNLSYFRGEAGQISESIFAGLETMYIESIINFSNELSLCMFAPDSMRRD